MKIRAWQENDRIKKNREISMDKHEMEKIKTLNALNKEADELAILIKKKLSLNII